MKVPTELAKVNSVGLIVLEGLGTWYNYSVPRITANGERYNPNSLTCAFYINSNEKRKYLNKFVRVTSKDTSFIIKIVDNGEFSDSKYKHLNHIIDFTPRVFRLLGGNLKDGVIKIKVEVL